ncbi:hypothetical protein ACFWFZ_26925 [Streptomyces sp. NPDC060232]|uniref:hypothetical protein n=1 Tax=Streptomyces sp. NPDC060232 TaxID=3347079 RepID=UPI00365B8045
MQPLVTSDRRFGHSPEEPAPHLDDPFPTARSTDARAGRPHDTRSGAARSVEAL